jgi:hypothetical protein
MERILVPQKRIDHIMQSMDPAILAAVVQELQAGTLKREARPAPDASAKKTEG